MILITKLFQALKKLKNDESVAIKDADNGETVVKWTLHIMRQWVRNNLTIKYIQTSWSILWL